MALKTSPSVRQRNRWLTVGGIALLAILGYLAFVRWDKLRCEWQGLSLFDRGEFSQAAEVLNRASSRYPRDQRLAFLTAVAFRRAGESDEFEVHLRRAERLGLAESEVRLQRLLGRTQHGLGDSSTEATLQEICLQGPDDFTAEQIYEAMAKGYMSVYQVNAARAALGYWTEWKPNAATPRFLRAQLAEQEQDMAGAEAEYRAILAVHPDNVEALFRLARLVAARHGQDEALQLLRQCARLRPGDPRVVIATAEIDYAQGKDSHAVEQALDGVVAADLDAEWRIRAWRVLSDIYLDRREYQRVVTLLAAPAEEGTLDVPLYHSLIRAYFALNQKERADHFVELRDRQMSLFQQARDIEGRIRNRPNDPDLRYRRGLISLEAGRPRDAMTWWYTALLADPLHQDSHEALVPLLTAQGDAAKAAQHQASAELSVQRTFDRAWVEYGRDHLDFVRSARKAIEKYPAFRAHAEFLAIALEIHDRRAQFDPARLQALESLLEYPTLRKHVLVLLGSALFYSDQFGRAEEVLHKALRLDPRTAEAHRWLAAIYRDVRVLDRMQVHCSEWAALDPTDYRPHRMLAAESRRREAHDLALTSYQESLRRNPPEEIRQEMLLELAECQLALGEVESALQSAESADAALPRDVIISSCYWKLDRADEARRLLDACLQRDPTNRPGNMLRAEIAVKEGDWEAAAECLERVVKEFPFDHAAWEMLSTVCSSLKQADRARECETKSDELRAAHAAYRAAADEAYGQPENAEIRREVASRARQIGRADLADQWERAAELIGTLNDRAAPSPPKQPSSVDHSAAPKAVEFGPPLPPRGSKR